MSRSSALNFFFKSTLSLPQAGPKTHALLDKMGISRIVDLLYHIPRALRVRHVLYAPSDDFIGKYVTLKLLIKAHLPSGKRGVPYQVQALTQDNTLVLLTFFKPYESYLRKIMVEGKTYFISGILTHYRHMYQINHPDYIKSKQEEIPISEPIYPLTAGLTSHKISQFIKHTFSDFPPLAEWHKGYTFTQEKFPSFKEALYALHFPQAPDDITPNAPAMRRLAYDEIIATTMTLKIIRRSQHKAKGVAVTTSPTTQEKLFSLLPFSLTDSQQKALSEIDKDMASPYKMIRLLQGDVGSGKTIVAVAAGLQAMLNGMQIVIMAPTEILAKQHHEDIKDILLHFNLQTALLTGKDKTKQKKQTLQDIATGAVHCVVGTHAVFQEDVAYKALALTVIDEQHRFGVHQRLLLSHKNKDANVLVMTATPIPRTLVMSVYGDLDVSRLTDKPKNRQPITTHIIQNSKMLELLEGLKRKIQNGEKVFWVCPLVEESEKIKVTSAEERFEFLKKHFSANQLSLIHGRLNSEQKDLAMQTFQQEKSGILVATSVIEVGVNIPEATVMIIENPERFGLAALHQLRGRIGRGSLAGNCILFVPQNLSQNAQNRLSVLKESTDGFYIAEKDLEIRGGGEILGTKQSGLPQMKFADFIEHKDLFIQAHHDVDAFLEKNPSLEGQEGENIKNLLYLFDQDTAILTKEAG